MGSLHLNSTEAGRILLEVSLEGEADQGVGGITASIINHYKELVRHKLKEQISEISNMGIFSTAP